MIPNAMPPFDFGLGETADALRDQVQRFSADQVAPIAAEIDKTDRIPEYVARAFDLAMSGRPGPVVLALPEDMLSAECDTPDLPPAPRPVPGVSAAQLAAMRLARGASARISLGAVSCSACSSSSDCHQPLSNVAIAPALTAAM